MNKSLDPLSPKSIKALRRQDLAILFEGEQDLRLQLQDELDKLKSKYDDMSESHLNLKGQFARLKAKLFAPSSEKGVDPLPKPQPDKKTPKDKKPRTKKPKLPSERYPNAPIVEHHLELEESPACTICSGVMEDAGLPEVSEQLEVIPRSYRIIRQVLKKYRCRCCHGPMVMAPKPPRIKAGSSYSDTMIIETAMSKYCDLIPLERLAAMAARDGFEGLPANSLIESTHHLAGFLSGTIKRIKAEVFSSAVLHADETPHKMLEGDKTSNWYLWGFSSSKAAYFECHNTRSGDVASNLLRQSQAVALVSDVFSGYGKAIRVTNKLREQEGASLLQSAFCNAHARRKFKEAFNRFPEQARYYLRCYKIIYMLEARAKEDGRVERARARMARFFSRMKEVGAEDLKKVSDKSALAMAIKYFTKNYDGFTLFLKDVRVPIDNNPQERLLRNPVVGRKTWYGTHSKRGAKTTATLFTIVESCKLNQINPRQYLKTLVEEIHQGKLPFTPTEFKEREKS